MNSWLCNMKRRQRIWNEQWTCQLVFAASPGARTLASEDRLKPPDWRWSKGEGWISWWEATPLTDWLSRAKILNPGFMSPSPDPGLMYQTQVLWVRFQNKLILASYQSSMYCWEENIIVAVIVKKREGGCEHFLSRDSSSCKMPTIYFWEKMKYRNVPWLIAINLNKVRSQKKNDIIWEFFPTWGGGSSQIPKLL